MLWIIMQILSSHTYINDLCDVQSITLQLPVFLYILMKSLEKWDVYRFLKKKSFNWDGFAMEHGLAWNS